MFTLNTTAFKAAIAAVGDAVAAKSTLPVLGAVRLQASPDGAYCTLTATNLEIGLTVPFTGTSDQSPETAMLPYAATKQIIGALPPTAPETITVTTERRKNGGIVAIVAIGDASFTLNSFDPDEFPTIPTINEQATWCYDRAAFIAAVDATVYAAATDDSRPILAGVAMRPTVTMGADGFRASFQRIAPQDDAPATMTSDLVVPRRALAAIAKIIKAKGIDDDTVTVAFNGNQCLFRCGGVEMVSRTIEGKFPDVERVMPLVDNDMLITSVDRDALIAWTKSAAGFAKVSQNTMKLAIATDAITLSANAADVGTANVKVAATRVADPVDVNGATVLTAVNVDYFLEALSHCDATVLIGYKANLAPLVFLDDQRRVAHLIMPMSIR